MSLGKVYYDPKHPAGFVSVAKFVKARKSKKMDVEQWLSGQKTYTLQKNQVERYSRAILIH